MTGDHIDDRDEIDLQEDEQLKETAKKRTTLGLKFPGMTAIAFEKALNIVIREVIGWDQETDMPGQNYKGLFGKVSAFTIAVEEQGRRSLHAH